MRRKVSESFKQLHDIAQRPSKYFCSEICNCKQINFGAIAFIFETCSGHCLRFLWRHKLFLVKKKKFLRELAWCENLSGIKAIFVNNSNWQVFGFRIGIFRYQSFKRFIMFQSISAKNLVTSRKWKLPAVLWSLKWIFRCRGSCF